MKLKISAEYLNDLAMQDGFTTLHYRIMLVLLTGKSYTKAQLATKLEKFPQNLAPPIKDLMDRGYVTVDRIEGRNKFLKAVLNRSSDNVEQGQLTF